MDYLYEKLDDFRFQALCQALLAREFKNVQCFPLRQPDGGRDAVMFSYRANKEADHVLFQIKFVRDPSLIQDVHKWLPSIVRGESPKVAKLFGKGIKQFVLITNLPGSGHLDAGSIDKVQVILDNEISCPTTVWWRDDLNRRLDSNFDLKWLYPDLLTGTDMLRMVIESANSADSIRIADTLRQYVRSQLDEDTEVRFKQVELQNQLLDLFVDVPMGVRQGGPRNIPNPSWRSGQNHFGESLDEPFIAGADKQETIGAAAVLLRSDLPQSLYMTVIEGAPGQGKSTLAQFLCQVYRMKLLGDSNFGNLQPQHQPSHGRVPFKIDLRDLADWLSRRNPFVPDDDKVPHDWAKSIDSFLAAQVSHAAGGAAFTVNDLHSFLKTSSVLFVFDGLDEVADMSRRKDVVSSITSGVSRLKDIAASLQVVITTRPTSYLTSIGFSDKDFRYVQLESLSKNLITEYSEKWIGARRLTGTVAASVRRVLKQKIEQSHLRDLARNPMQLAILLSLIHTRGTSLPDKRTALYDSYVELFFNREAEKDETVRDNRDLLIDLHRYLGWILHAQVETGSHRGSVTIENLKRTLYSYLRNEGKDIAKVEALFTGMVERIVFLVSRVEGTLEFEVQPLREYFAARHLYETAPYSPAGAERPGTKPDRLDAIAQNPYWLNVTRFFSGCFSKGELPCIVERLRELSERGDFRFTSFTRRLTAMLLSDWVFSQDQRSTKEAIALVLAGNSVYRPVSSRRRARYLGGDDILVLPDGCGREEIVRRCFSILCATDEPREDYVQEIAEVLRANGTSSEVDDGWFKSLTVSDSSRLLFWLKSGLYLASLARVAIDRIVPTLKDYAVDDNCLAVMASAGRYDIICKFVGMPQSWVDSILDGRVASRSRTNHWLGAFADALSVNTFATVFFQSSGESFGHIRTRYQSATDEVEDGGSSIAESKESNEMLIGACSAVLAVFNEELSTSTHNWSTNLAPWNHIVEEIRSQFGDRRVAFALANMASGIKSSQILCNDDFEFFDTKRSLCGRVRYARLKSGAHSWWENILRRAQSEELILSLLVFSTWASARTKLRLASIVDPLLNSLTQEDWNFIARTSELTRGTVVQRPPNVLEDLDAISSASPRFVFVLSLSCSWPDILNLYTRFLSDYDGKDNEILDLCERALLTIVINDPSYWERVLGLISKRRRSGSFIQWAVHQNSSAIPVDVARAVLANARLYPPSLIYVAEERLRSEIEQGSQPVLQIAKREGWFDFAGEQQLEIEFDTNHISN